MERLALCPNVVSKLSGLGTFIHRNDVSHIDGIVKETVELFGSGRCLFGSNFPIEKLWTDYATLFGSYRSAIKSLSAGDQRAILHDTAANIYRIN
jgi:predicted TIM-barrel fold metal-dependent hydrolase